MPVFYYQAKTSDGKDVSGQKEAANVGALVSELKRSGYIVLNVEEPGKGGAAKKDAAKSAAAPEPEVKPQGRKSGKRKAVTVRDLAIFCRQLSTMLKAGLSIIDALETIGNETENLTLQEVLFAMRDDIEAGSSMSEAVNKHPKTFSLMFRAMIEAGEASGSLTKIVAQLGEYLKKRDALQKKIKAATMYPKFVMGFFSVIVTGILLFLVPQFEDTFSSLSKPCKICGDRNAPAVQDPAFPDDPKKKKQPPGTGWAKIDPTDVNKERLVPAKQGEEGAIKCPKCKGEGVSVKLPGMTQAMLDMSRFIKNNVLIVIGIVVLMFVLWKQYSSSATGRSQLDRLILKLPVAGPLSLKSAMARYCMTLSTLLHNGVSLDQSLDIVSRVAGNTLVEEATQGVRELIVQGQGLSASMCKFPIFPMMVNKMISVGEESGALAEMLTDIAEYYEEEVNSAVEGISTVIEPLMIVLIGAVVCVVVLALYLPIFNMGKALTS